MKRILVFRTSVEGSDSNLIEAVLSGFLNKEKWNFDFEDCDNILRIETARDISKIVRFVLHYFGYECEELE